MQVINTRIKWNGVLSKSFSVCNSVRQGGVASPVLVCIYIDGLLKILADNGVGCTIGCKFIGILVYADDIVLLAPSANAMRIMLNICDNYAKDYNIVFNANKSNLIFVTTRCKLNVGPNPVFKINGQTIDYVDQWPHLGHIISSNLDDKADIMQRRNVMVGQINNVLCYFGKLDHL